jgi:hypothetical protein
MTDWNFKSTQNYILVGLAAFGGYYFGLAKPSWEEKEQINKDVAHSIVTLMENVISIDKYRNFNEEDYGGAHTIERQNPDGTTEAYIPATYIDQFTTKLTKDEYNAVSEVLKEHRPTGWEEMVAKAEFPKDSSTVKMYIKFNETASYLAGTDAYPGQRADEILENFGVQNEAKINIKNSSYMDP